MTYPLDIIKTYLTVHVEDGSAGVMKTGRWIVNTHGFLGLYKGLGTSLMGIAPFIGIKMATFD